jgi:hypothetical protein
MALFYTRAVPSAAILPPNTRLGVQSLFQLTSRALQFSNRPHLLKSAISTPTQETSCGRRLSNRACFLPQPWSPSISPHPYSKLGLTTDETLLAEHVRALNEKLDVYDAILNKQKYLTGDVCYLCILGERLLILCLQEFTLVDIFHLPHGSLLSVNGAHLLEKKPNVARYLPSFRAPTLH